MPIVFERNKGQTNSDYSFVARRAGVDTYLGDSKVSLVLRTARGASSRLDLTFAHANANTAATGEDLLPSVSNYLTGANRDNWIRGAANYGRVRYSGLYAGVDLLFYGNQQTLEHDFVVAPGGDPSVINFAVTGAQRTTITERGDLDMTLGGGTLRFNKPVAYQIVGEHRREVPVRFVRKGKLIAFALGKYDHALPLTIDPVLSFATYFNGSKQDTINAVTTDSSGNIYVTGTTASPDFPVSAGALQPACTNCANQFGSPDAFISKLDPTGKTLLYSTYIGGTNGDIGNSIVVDGAGNIIVAGSTSSIDFPSAGAFPVQVPQGNNTDHFLVSLKPDGTAFNYAGTIGQTDFFNTIGKVAVDAQGNAYLTGQTNSAQFPVTPGTLTGPAPGFPFTSTFILKVDAAGALVYSTLIPANAPQDPATQNNNFRPNGIAVDNAGNVIIGGTADIGLPTTPGVIGPALPPSPFINATEGFLLKVNNTASALLFATYLPETFVGSALAVDANGNSYVAGFTNSTTFPVTANAFQKTVNAGQNCVCNFGYVMKVDSVGQNIVAATYLTGTTASSNIGTNFSAIALDSNSNVLLAGPTASADFPLKNPFENDLASSTLGFSGGEFIAELNSDLSTELFGTFLHGGGSFAGTSFTSAAFDPSNQPIVVGNTFSTDFPTTAGSFQPTAPASSNPFTTFQRSVIAKLDLATPSSSACLNTFQVNFGRVLVNTTATKTVQVQNCGNAPLTVQSVQSASTLVVATQSCAAVAPGASCSIQLAYTPVDGSFLSGTLTVTTDGALKTRSVSLSGKGGIPSLQVFAPNTVGDILVGTSSAPQPVIVFNDGDGALLIGGVTASGDFSVQNGCTRALQPGDVCELDVTFSPQQPGLRTGTLTIIDNASGSPHNVALNGNGLVTYPAPTISSMNAISQRDTGAQVIISGTNFFPDSTVFFNGDRRPTTLVNQTTVLVSLQPGDLSAVGEVPMTVFTSTPGGGTSNVFPLTIYGQLQNLLVRHMVFDKTSGLIYASTSASSPVSPNAVVAVDPLSMTVSSTVLIGNGPNQIALSDDGTLIYVGLDDSRQVAQVSLPSGTVNFTVGLGNDSLFHNPMVANSLIVVPGHPHTWVVSTCGVSFTPCGQGIMVFDNATARPSVVSQDQLSPDSMTFLGNDSSTLYATSLSFSPSEFYKFQISATGISLLSTTQNFTSASPGGGILASDGTLIFVSNGQIIDPATVAIKATLSALPGFASLALDPTNSRIYFGGANPGSSFDNPAPSTIIALDRGTQQLLGTLLIPETPAFSGNATLRFGTNGIALNTASSLIFVKTRLTGTPATVGAGLTVSTGKLSYPLTLLSAAAAPQTLTVTNSGAKGLHISGVTASGDFSQTNNCATLATGASCTVTVTFKPTALGTRAGTLTITDDAVGTSQTIELQGVGGDFQITGASGATSATVPAGQAATFNLTLAAQAGFNGTVNLTCANLPALSTCSIQPASITAGATPVAFIVRVTTSQTRTASITPQTSVVFATVSWLAVVPLMFFAFSGRKHARVTIGLLLVAILIGGMVGCGGGGGSQPTTTVTQSTPPGTYTVTVNASTGGVTRSINLTLTVQ